MLSDEKGLQESREAQEAKNRKAELRRQMMAGQQAQQAAQPTSQPKPEEGGVVSTPAKRGRKKTKAATIAERRPLQKSIHFTDADNIEIEHHKLQLIRAGVPRQDVNAENIIYFFFRHCIEQFKDGIPAEEFTNSII